MDINSELLLQSSNSIGIAATDRENDLGYHKFLMIPGYY